MVKRALYPKISSSVGKESSVSMQERGELMIGMVIRLGWEIICLAFTLSRGCTGESHSVGEQASWQAEGEKGDFVTDNYFFI